MNKINHQILCILLDYRYIVLKFVILLNKVLIYYLA